MTTRVSSRLARKQQRKIVLQTVLLVVAAIALGLGFLFYILPNSVRVLNLLSGGTPPSASPTTSQSGIPLQAPLLSAPPEATSSAQITLSGFAQQNETIVLLKNGQQAGQTTVNNDGTFSFDVNLDEGSNVLAAFARDADQKESNPSQSFTVVKDTQPPSLTITQPTDGQSFQLQQNQVITITGTTDAGSQIQVNGRLVYANDQGGFSTTYQLQEGDNKLEIIATDQAGNQTTKDLTVHFSP